VKERPLTYTEAEDIPNTQERIFALATILKNLIVFHQPKIIKTPKGNTQPDFLVKNPNHSNSNGTFVEVGRGLEANPHKKRQAKIMALTNHRYVQLRGNHIDNIAAANDLDED
jgi:hypothetical protein